MHSPARNADRKRGQTGNVNVYVASGKPAPTSSMNRLLHIRGNPPIKKPGILRCRVSWNASGDGSARDVLVFGDSLHRQADTALLVDFENLDLDDVAFLQLVRDLLDALAGDLRDVDETVLARHDRDECTEVHQLGNLALVDAARLDVRNDLLDALARGFGGFAVDRRDDHVAVIGDVDRGTGLFGDRTDGRAPLADHFADLGRVGLEREQ